MNPKMFQQVECVDAIEDNGAPIRSAREGAILLVWVEAHRVKRGDQIRFKETGDLWWRVSECFSTLVSDVNRGWGLDLPKSHRTEL